MPEPITAEISRHVEWVDTDASRHHHNSLIWRLVESAEAELMRQIGQLDEYFNNAPRVRQEVNFESKLYFGQRVTARIYLERIGTASMTFNFEVWGDEYQGRPARQAASGSWVVVHVELGTEESSPWPQELREALRPTTA